MLSIKQTSLEDLDNPDVLLQSGFWGKLKSEFGWQPLAFRVHEAPLLLLVRPFGRGCSLAYVPFGPVGWGKAQSAEFPELARALSPYLPRNCFFIRFDLAWGEMENNHGRPALPSPFRKSTMDIQPPDTVILDLSLSEEEILQGMKSKTRYNIRLAKKKGVEIIETGEQGLNDWYDLYRMTAARDKISIHSLKYYHQVFKLAQEYGNRGLDLKLYLAYHEEELLAGNIVAFHGKGATYLYGATSNRKRNLMPAYALQWQAIREARQRGCRSYDLFGIPPADNPDHPMHGLYRFKTGFGGTIIHRPGCWDYPRRPLLYKGFRIAEGLRRYYYKVLRKR